MDEQEIGDASVPTDVPPEAQVDADVTRMDVGVRLRTHIQAGSASERVETTMETHAESLAALVTRLDSHRAILSEELREAKALAEEVNE